MKCWQVNRLGVWKTGDLKIIYIKFIGFKEKGKKMVEWKENSVKRKKKDKTK